MLKNNLMELESDLNVILQLDGYQTYKYCNLFNQYYQRKMNRYFINKFPQLFQNFSRPWNCYFKIPDNFFRFFVIILTLIRTLSCTLRCLWRHIWERLQCNRVWSTCWTSPVSISVVLWRNMTVYTEATKVSWHKTWLASFWSLASIMCYLRLTV